ncbi:putative glycoside hydrolase [Streptomyces sp. G-G2]|uniref:putative glycoside hydrolase n=1 Tax=Streptomyces sp. G-G2 TaxID=3046201 RepID=UPI0024B93A4F|nr:putative glycoside hydrolase [Streptomyces sp. G-G2]MDJ0385807.1 putative glycoside hydrolase [Streptomyces sp. G-G2]
MRSTKHISRSTPSYRLRRPARRHALIATAVTLALAGAGVGAWTFLAPGPGIQGLNDGAVLNGRKAAQISAYLDAEAAGSRDKVRATLDGAEVPLTVQGARLKLTLPHLAEGRHTLVVAGGSSLPFASYREAVGFTVDTTAPDLRVADPEIKNVAAPVTITGNASTDAKVTVDGKKVPVDKAGAFKITVPKGTPLVTVTAVDRAGNTTTKAVSARGRRPMIRAAHITAIGWGDNTLRGNILALVRSGKLNAVELDVKDEDGEVGYASEVPLARQIGAAKGYYDARKAVAEIHAAGAQVIGRIVAFRDPKLASAAWKAGKRDQLVLTPAGQPYDGGHYGALSFTNFADPTVRKYNRDLAVEAARLGFDDILYDYVRRPDGPLSQMRFPGIGTSTPEQSITSFVADTRTALRPHATYLGVSVFGIAATRPTEIAQDIGALVKVTDYIAPMVYPSHWGPGEYGVAHPDTDPYAIVQRSLADFARQAKGTQTEIIPWLQDFSMGSDYGPAQVAEQIKAAAADKMNSFILWNAGARYQGAALQQIATR